MKYVCVAVVDAERARIFTLQKGDESNRTPVQELREQADIFDPDRPMRASRPFSDSGPDGNRAPGWRGDAAGDQREAHVDEPDRRFAGQVVARIEQVARASGCHHLVLAASPGVLGQLRRCGGRRLARELSVDEVDCVLIHMSSAQLHDYLAERGLLPPRARVARAAL